MSRGVGHGDLQMSLPTSTTLSSLGLSLWRQGMFPSPLTAIGGAKSGRSVGTEEVTRAPPPALLGCPLPGPCAQGTSFSSQDLISPRLKPACKAVRRYQTSCKAGFPFLGHLPSWLDGQWWVAPGTPVMSESDCDIPLTWLLFSSHRLSPSAFCPGLLRAYTQGVQAPAGSWSWSSSFGLVESNSSGRSAKAASSNTPLPSARLQGAVGPAQGLSWGRGHEEAAGAIQR